jgi:hypothetical protein
MTRTKTTHSDAILHAAAIARWDDEGGASTSARNKTAVKAVKDVASITTRLASNLAAIERSEARRSIANTRL